MFTHSSDIQPVIMYLTNSFATKVDNIRFTHLLKLFISYMEV